MLNKVKKTAKKINWKSPFVYVILCSLCFSAAFFAVFFVRGHVTYITKQKEITCINENLGGKYKMHITNARLDDPFVPIGTKEKPFTGEFDGDGVTFTYINYAPLDTGDESIMSLFGYSTGTIKNINIWYRESNGVTFTVENAVNVAFGLICAYNYGTIENCYVLFNSSIEVKISGSATISAVCAVNEGTIKNVKSEGQTKIENSSNAAITTDGLAAKNNGDVSSGNTNWAIFELV